MNDRHSELFDDPGALSEVEIVQMATTGDFDDGLHFFERDELGKQSQGDQTISGSGFKVAKTWNKCKHKVNYSEALRPHYVDSVASGRYNFLYVDNVKAGSSSMRSAFSSILQTSWHQTDIPGAKPTGQCCRCPEGCRYSSKDFNETLHMFKFSVVRDPVAKFESGVRQARFQDPGHFSNMSADEILEEVISSGRFTNEHLMPSSYRLSAFDASTPPSMVNFDFIGKLEHFDNDWSRIVDGMQGLDKALRKELKRSLGQVNGREDDPTSKLTEVGIQRMCQSSMYKFEWDCFDYELPHVCNRG
jgi:hypothetical protein